MEEPYTSYKGTLYMYIYIYIHKEPYPFSLTPIITSVYKRALYLRKRAMHIFPRSHTCTHRRAWPSQVCAKEPYISAKEPYIHLHAHIHVPTGGPGPHKCAQKSPTSPQKSHAYISTLTYMYPQAGLTLTSVRMMNFGAVGVSLWICEESLSIYCRSLLMEYRSVLMEHRSFLIELRARCCLCDWVFRCEGVSLDTWGVSFHGISVSFDGMYVSFHGTQVSFGGVVVQVSFVEIQVSLDRTWWSLILWNIRLFWWNTRLFSWDTGLFWSNTSLFWWNQKGVSFEGVSFDRIWVSFDPIKGSQVFVWHLSVYIAEVCIPYWQKGGGETSAIGRAALQTYDRIPYVFLMTYFKSFDQVKGFQVSAWHISVL